MENKNDIIIKIPDNMDDDGIVIDLDALGIDLDELSDDVEVIIEVENENPDEYYAEGTDDNIEANEWCFDDDPYNIVYYEFVNEDAY